MQAIQAQMVGRDTAKQELQRALTATEEGAGGCVVVEGPPGIGKSRVLEIAAAKAAAANMAVASGRASELDRVAPLTTLVSSLGTTGEPELAMKDLDAADPSPLGMVDRLRGMLEDYSRTRGLVVCIDDAHWADELTALALRVLVPALSSSPVLWLLARRPGPIPERTQNAQDAIDWLLGGPAKRLSLEPLDEEAVQTMCAQLLGARPDESVLELATRGHGNPFLLELLLTTLRDTGQVDIAKGKATLTSDNLPADFLSAVHYRLRELSPVARRLLEAGSVLGRPFNLHEAAGLVGAPTAQLIPAATEALEYDTLEGTGTELVFRHDLVREAVYQGLPLPVRLALHRQAASVVEAEGRSPVEAAEHLVRGGHLGDEHAVGVLRDAVARISPKAPSTAADLIMRMLDLLGEHDPARPQMTAEAVHLLASAGRVAEARDLGERALRSGLAPSAEGALLLGLSEALKHAGDNRAVVDATRRALARDGVPDVTRARLLAIQAHGLLDAADLSEADAAGAAAVEVGAQTGEYGAMAFGSVARSVASRSRGDLAESTEYAQEAVRTVDNAGGEASHRHPRLWLGRSLAALDQFSEAHAVYEMGQREADQLGTAWSQPLWHYYRSELRMAAGRLNDAAAEAEAGVRVAQQLNALALSVPLHGILGHLAMHRDELDDANAQLRQAKQLIAEGVCVGPEDLAWRVALVQAAEGDAAKAMETLSDVYEGFPDRVLILAQEPGAAAQLVRMARAVSAPEHAEATVAAARVLADRNPTVVSLVAGAAHAEGLLRGHLPTLRDAVAAYTASPRPLARALALEDTALAEDAGGERSAAIELMEQALALYEASAARRDVARVNQRMRGLGVRGASTPEPVEGTILDSLTESELRVARLVADGMTNREIAGRLFLSPHTVDSHIRHSFTKLGVNSRVQLTRYVLEYDSAPE